MFIVIEFSCDVISNISNRVFFRGGYNKVFSVQAFETIHDNRRKIFAVDELSQGGASASYLERDALFLGQVTLVDERWDHVPIFERVVVSRPVDVGGNYARKVGVVLFIVCATVDLHNPLCVGIRVVRKMRRTVVKHRFVDGVRRLVGENTRRQDANAFVHVNFVRALQHIEVDLEVLLEHVDFEIHVLIQSAYTCGQMNYIVGFT